MMSLLLYPEKVSMVVGKYSAHIGGEIYLVVIVAIVAGLSISSLGGVIITLMDLVFKPRWYWVDKEYSYWKKLGEFTKDNEFLRGKIQRRWEYFVTNLNAGIAHLLVFTISLFEGSNSGVTQLFVIIFFAIHFCLACCAYCTARKFADLVEA